MTPRYAALPARAGWLWSRRFFLAVKPEISEGLLRLNRRGSGKVFSRGRSLAAVALLVGVGIAALRYVSAYPVAGDRSPNSSPSVVLSQVSPMSSRAADTRVEYADLPLIFEANRGQSDPSVEFLARGRGYSLFLRKEDAVLVLQQRAANTRRSTAVVSLKLADADPAAEITAIDQLPGKSNYFVGNDPTKWRRNVPQFARVRYRHVYPGIDLAYYGKQGRLEYDFEVAPGADPKLVSLLVQCAGETGAGKLRMDQQGDLVLATAAGEVRFASPRIYQENGADEKAVAGRFALRGDGRVGFEIGDYDRSRALIIDPLISYSTYLGGSGAESCSAITGADFTPRCPAIAVDSASDAYIAGATTSTVNFPNPAGVATSNTVNGPADVFITKFDNTGTNQLFTTYLGGSGTDTPAGIAVDSGFDVVVTGTTNSTDFPSTIGAYQSVPESSGNKHVFVTRLDPSGSAVQYSTYLSGNGVDVATGVALDLQGKIYVTGTTTSTDTPSLTDVFPATVGAFQPNSLAANQFFMTKVDPTLSEAQSVPYSTYFGGSNPANGQAVGGGIAVDVNGNVYITGGTSFLHLGVAGDFPILNAFQTCLDQPEAVAIIPPATPPVCNAANTAEDAFVAEINPTAASGAQLLYSTYVGGSGNDIGYGIAVDIGGNAYITGSTTSTDFALGSGTIPYQGGNAGGRDAFLAKISSFIPPVTTSSTTTAVVLLYSTYLGGSGDDVGTAIAMDPVGGARITGWTNSADLPTQSPVQAALGGGRDAFVANLDTTAVAACQPSATVHCASYVSYLGGGGTDMGTGIAVDPQGASYVVGETASPNFPLTPPPGIPFQGARSGPSDAFVTRLSPIAKLLMTGSASPTPVGVGNEVTFTYVVTNVGDVATGVSFIDNYSQSSPNANFVAATASPGSCGTQVVGGSVQCNLGNLSTTPVGSVAATVSITLTPTPPTTATPQVPPPIPPPLGNTATVSAAGGSQASASAEATVNDFAITVAPPTQTVVAGGLATYQLQLTPTGAIPSSVSLTASSGLPTGATATFTTNPFTNLDNGPVTSYLNIGTTTEVTTTTQLRRWGGPFYTGWLPISGLALLGAGVGGSMSRKRRWLLGALLGGFLTLILFLPGCGTTATTTTTTGTPPGNYEVTVSATSGSATRTTTVQLTVVANTSN